MATMSFWVGLILGIAFSNIVTGLVLIWSDRPKRNCDIGTPEEQCYRFEDYCAEHGDRDEYDICVSCPLKDARDCRIFWMNLPYEKKEDKQ